MTASPIHFVLSAILLVAVIGPATAQVSGKSGKERETVRIRLADPDAQIFQVFIDRKPVTVLYRKDNEVGLEIVAGEDGIECRHDVAVVTSDGRLADLPGVNFCDTDWVVTVETSSLSGGSGAKPPPGSGATRPVAQAAAPAGEDCGWLAIMACQPDSAAAERDSTRIMGGVSVISTDDYQGFEPGLYCAAQGPYATEAEAEQTAGFFRGKGAPDAYTRQACEAVAPPADGSPGADAPSGEDGGEDVAEDAAPTPDTRELELEPGWSFIPPTEPANQPLLAYVDASSGTLQFLAACGAGDGIAVTLYRADGTAAGTQVDVSLATSGFRQRYQATVSADSGSVSLATAPDDPLWRALAAHTRLDVDIGTLGSYSLSLRGSGVMVRPFVDACTRAPSAPAGQSEADAPQGGQPGAGTTAPSGAVRYACDGGPRLQVFYDGPRNRAVVSVAGGEPIVLDHVPSGSGALYRAGAFELHNKGGEAVWTEPGNRQVFCRGQ
jgi:membrane-bound inhibitor of C-type lysozyme